MNSSDRIKVFRLNFDPIIKEYDDIFNNPISRGLWCMYRAWHIMSKEDIQELNDFCRNEIVRLCKTSFTKEDAIKLLDDYGRGGDAWRLETLPYITGEKEILIEIVQKDVRGIS